MVKKYYIFRIQKNFEKFRKKLKTEKIQKNLEIYNYKEIQKFKFIKVNYI